MNKYVTFHKDGSVSVDLAAYLQTPEGRAQLDSLKDLKPRSEFICSRCHHRQDPPNNGEALF